MNAEKWVPISGFNGIYEISDMGRIKSHRKHYGYDEEGHILSIKNSKGDYLRVVLYGDDKKIKRTASIHVLVYENFVGDIPDGYDVHHINGNKQDNRLENLKIVTKAEHYVLTRKQYPNYCDGMNYYNKYIHPKEICMFSIDGQYLASFPNAVIAEKITGVCSRNITQVASHTEYKKGMTRSQAGGYIWIYKEELNENQMYRLR